MFFVKYTINFFFISLIFLSVFYPQVLYSTISFDSIICFVLVIFYTRFICSLGVEKEKPFLWIKGPVLRLLNFISYRKYDFFFNFCLLNLSVYYRIFIFFYCAFGFYLSIINFIFTYPPIALPLFDFIYYLFKYVQSSVGDAFAVENNNSNINTYSSPEEARKYLFSNSRSSFYTHPIYSMLLFSSAFGLYMHKANPVVLQGLKSFFLKNEPLTAESLSQINKFVFFTAVSGYTASQLNYLIFAQYKTGEPIKVLSDYMFPSVHDNYPDKSMSLEYAKKVELLLYTIERGKNMDEYIKCFNDLPDSVRRFYIDSYYISVKKGMMCSNVTSSNHESLIPIDSKKTILDSNKIYKE